MGTCLLTLLATPTPTPVSLTQPRTDNPLSNNPGGRAQRAREIAAGADRPAPFLTADLAQAIERLEVYRTVTDRLLDGGPRLVAVSTAWAKMM